MVASGSARAIAVATAGCIAGCDPKNVWQLPDTTGLKSEVIMLGGRTAFDNAIRLCGAKLVIVPTVDGLKAAINPQTAMIYATWKDERVSEVLKISKPAGVPVLLDAAAGIPPFENFTRFAKMGVDLYCFSEDKGFHGPQCPGILLGRYDLVPAVSGREPWSPVNHLPIISITLQEGEDLVVGNSLRRILNQARKQSA